MNRKVALLLLSCPLLPVFAQVAAVSTDENAAMETYASKWFGLSQDLHTLSGTFQDGIKGVRWGTKGPGPDLFVADNSPISVETMVLHNRFCKATAIVVAEETGSVARITSNKSFIYTKQDFLIRQIFKPASGIESGAQIEVYRPGGSVIDNGEKVSLETPGIAPFKVGQTYLLILFRVPDSARGLFVPQSEFETIEVISDRIFLPWGGYADDDIKEFVSGETLSQVASSFKQAQAWSHSQCAYGAPLN